MKTRRAEAYWVPERKRWQINVQRDGRRKTFVSSKPGRTGKHEAETKADRWLEDFSEEQTFENASRLFFEDIRKDIRETSYVMYTSLYNNHVKPCIPPSKKLSTITLYDWQNILDNCADKSRNTCAGVRNIINMIVNYSIKRGWAVKSVEGLLDIPVQATAAKQKRAISNEEIARLMEISTDEYWFANVYKFIVLTGLRRGEAMALMWNDVDMAKACLRVQRNVNGMGEINTGKTKNAERTVPLQTTAMNVLQDQKKLIQSMQISSPYIFPTADGKMIEKTKIVTEEFMRVCKKHKINATLHELRHTFISILKSDMPIALLKQAVGHSTSMDTIGIYGHEVESDVGQIAEIIETSFKKNTKKS